MKNLHRLAVLASSALLLAGCQALEFPPDESANGSSGGEGPEAVTDGAGGGSGDPTTSTGAGGGDPPAETLVGPGIPQQFQGPAPLDFPTCTDAPVNTERTELPSVPSRSFATAQFARAVVLAGDLPPRESVRVDDFLGYWGAHTPANTPSVRTRFIKDAATANKGTYEVRVQLGKAPPVAPGGRNAVHFIVVADISQSMAAAIPLEEAALERIGATVGASGDRLSLITFAGVPTVVFDDEAGTAMHKTLTDDPELLSTRLGGDLEGALREARNLLSDTLEDHVVVLSDAGMPLTTELTSQLADLRAAGARASIVQLGKPARQGPSVLHDAFLAGFAQAGDGSALYVGDEAEVDQVLGARFDELFIPAAMGGYLVADVPGGFASLETEPVNTGAELIGVRVNYGRSHAFTHRMSLCADAEQFANGNTNPGSYLPVESSFHDTFAPDAPLATGSDEFDASFFSPSPELALEAAIVDAAIYFRTWDAARFDAARCALAALEQGDCGAGGGVCASAADLANLLDLSSAKTGATSSCSP